MVSGKSREEIWNKILNYYSDFAGRKLSVNEEVFKSEADTNQRNQAIGKLMYAYGRIKDNPDQATDIYTEQCSVNVNARDLAMMAATLANGGKNPVTGKQVMRNENVAEVLAVMATAGLVRRFRQVAVRHRPARQERRGRRHHRRLTGPLRHRRDLAAAGCRRQQRAGAEGDCGHVQCAGRQSLRRDASQVTRRNYTEENKMLTHRKALLPVAVLWASSTLNAEAATDAERIAALEAQLKQQQAVMQQQQRMMETMNAELQRLKTSDAGRHHATRYARCAVSPRPARSTAPHDASTA